MAQPLLWVQTATAFNDTAHKRSKSEVARIRSHAQCYRPRLNASSDDGRGNVRGLSQISKQQVEGIRTAHVQSSRPSKTLGRLASSKPSVTGRKLQKPKNGRDKASTLRLAATSNSAPTLVQNPSWLWPFLSSSERRSLAFFELRTSQEWSGWEDSYFWNTLALQVSQQSQAVARSLIAVSCLHEVMETVGHVERARLQNASSQQSMKATRLLSDKSEMPYFEALVSCIIMICFHGIRHSRASFLLRSGQKLLEECRSGHASKEELDLIEKQLSPLFNRLLSKSCRVGDIRASLRQSIRRHRAQHPCRLSNTPLVATSFSSLAEARQSLQQILDWAHDHVPLDAESSLFQEHFLGTLHRLKSAWESALAQSDLGGSLYSNKSQNILRAACVVGVILIETVDHRQEMIFDGYEHDFELAISLIEQARSSQHTADFGIDSGLIDIIAFVGTKCRDPLIRRRALRLLKGAGRIEGDRIASNPATIMEALIALEERDLVVLSCHDVPKSNRRQLIRGYQYFAQRRIDLFYEASDGSHKEMCSVSLAAPGTEKAAMKPNAGADVPDVIFGWGHAAFLEDRSKKTYFRLDMERFYFPIPKL